MHEKKTSIHKTSQLVKKNYALFKGIISVIKTFFNCLSISIILKKRINKKKGF